MLAKQVAAFTGPAVVACEQSPGKDRNKIQQAIEARQAGPDAAWDISQVCMVLLPNFNLKP